MSLSLPIDSICSQHMYTQTKLDLQDLSSKQLTLA